MGHDRKEVFAIFCHCRYNIIQALESLKIGNGKESHMKKVREHEKGR
jgi:hypothetical protein